MVDGQRVSEQLVEAAKAGDARAMSEVLAGVHPHVQRFAYSLCASPEDAEDAAQEALVILFRKLGSLRASGALLSWMWRIIKNECLRRTRHALRQADRSDDHDREMLSAEDIAVQRLEAQRVALAITALPETQRRVLVMRDVLGYPGRTVADGLGLSNTAMKSQLNRARTSLKAALKPDSVTN